MFKDFAIYGVNPSNGQPLTDPAVSYVRNGTDVTSGHIGAAWTRPLLTFTPDRDAKYLGVGARITSPDQATIGQEYNKAQYFTKWQLERAKSNGLPTTYGPAREVQIIVKPDLINLFPNPGFESLAGAQNQGMTRNTAQNPRGINSGNTVEYGMRWSWTLSYLTGLTPVVGDVTTAARATVPAAGETGVTSRGVDLYCNLDIVPPTSGAAIQQPVVAGEVVTLSIYVRSSVATTYALSAKTHDGAGNWIGSGTSGTAVAVAANTWTRLSVTVTVPAGGLYLAASVRNTVSTTFPTGSTLDLTGILVMRSAFVLDYFDGTTKTGRWNHADFRVTWVGTANSSQSTLEAVRVANRMSGNRTMPILSNAWSSKGTYSLRLTPLNPVGGTTTSRDVYASINLLSMGCREGETYTIRAVAHQDGVLSGASGAPAQARNLFIDITGGGGGTRGLKNTPSHTNAAGDYEHVLTFTVPSVAGSPVTAMNLRFYHGHDFGSEDLWWDEVTITPGTEPIPYVDGSLGDDYLWEEGGTAHDARSYYYENRLDRVEAIRRALRDSVPLGIGVAEPKFAVWTE